MVLLFPSAVESSLDRFEYLGWQDGASVRYMEVAFGEGDIAKPRIKEGDLHEANLRPWLRKVDSVHSDGSQSDHVRSSDMKI